MPSNDDAAQTLPHCPKCEHSWDDHIYTTWLEGRGIAGQQCTVCPCQLISWYRNDPNVAAKDGDGEA